MGFIKNLFGGGRDKSEPDDHLSEDEYDESERLSEEDAQDIFDSSGRDEDYDFRPSSYEDDDEDEWDGDPADIKYDVEQAKENYRRSLTPLVTPRAGTPPEYDEDNLYTFVCMDCDGYGVELFAHPVGIEEEECSGCYGTGLQERDGEDAMDRLDWGEVPIYINEQDY